MPERKLNVLVTGANGFLGSNVLKTFLARPEVSIIAACRNRTKLHRAFTGEIREGDLRDIQYLQGLVKDVDVICHTGTWAAMWDHTHLEEQNFYQPTLNLINAAIEAGVKRFLLASTVVIAKRRKTQGQIEDFSETQKTGFWPHLDYLIELDYYMQANANRGTQMVNMRLGHFVGAGNTLGLVPVLVPRLKTWLVPWLAKGTSRLPLITDTDLGNSFVRASLADNLNNYESFNICGKSFPTTREVIDYISIKAGLPKPLFSVPYPLGYAFARMMEMLFPVLPGKAPFLTRSVVHLAENWLCDTRYTRNKIGYVAEKEWQTAIDEALAEIKRRNYPWPAMAQKNQ